MVKAADQDLQPKQLIHHCVQDRFVTALGGGQFPLLPLTAAA
jgi:hypothetical protein